MWAHGRVVGVMVPARSFLLWSFLLALLLFNVPRTSLMLPAPNTARSIMLANSLGLMMPIP